MCHALCKSREACSLLNRDEPGVDREGGLDGKEDGVGGEEGGETGWYVK